VGGGYSLMNNKTFRANSKEGTWEKDVEAWMGGKGSGDGGSLQQKVSLYTKWFH
jgi:hypothetical protein